MARHYPYVRFGLTSIVLLIATASTTLASPVTWSFNIQTLGQNVTWTSPTATNPNADLYEVGWTITKLEVRVVIIFPTWIDVTGQIPPEYLNGSTIEIGPAPIVAADQDVVFPDPPTAPAFQGHLTVGLDATGHGYVSLTNVLFGTIGPPYVPITVALTGIRIQGTVDVNPVVLCTGDMNCDGVVDFADIDAFVEALSYPGGVGWPYACPWLNGDANGDWVVDFADIDDFVTRLFTTCN